MSTEQMITYARQHFPALIQPRSLDSHKGSFGSIGIIGGAQGMTGAALLSARAALYQGAGRIYIGFAQSSLPFAVDFNYPELMLRTATDILNLNHITAWVIGCGLGVDNDSLAILEKTLTLHPAIPKILDADALNLIAKNNIDLPHEEGDIIITPHPLEASRLLNLSAIDVQNNREATAKALAAKFNAWVVLKGHQSVICSPNGVTSLNTSGNPSLATGGTGDVLAGMIGALIAQGIPIEQAVRGGVWLHGASADYCSQYVTQGQIGLTASEVALHARTIRNLLFQIT